MTEERVTEHTEMDTPHIDWAERRRMRAASRRQNSRSRYVWLVVGIVVGLLVLLAVVEAGASAGRIHPGVTVAGIEVGGLNPKRAAAKLEARLPAAADQPVTVTYKDKSWDVNATEVGLAFNYSETVDRAMAVGRSKSAFNSLGQRLGAWFKGVDVRPSAVSTPEKMNAALDKIAAETDIAPKDATVEIDGTTAKVVSSADGMALQRDVVGRAILSAFTAKNRTVPAPVAVAKVAVTDLEAEQAKAVAQIMYSKPVVVTYDNKQWTFAEEKVAGWLAFRRSDEPAESAEESSDVPSAEATGSAGGEVTLVAYVSAKAAAKSVLSAVGTGIGRPAKNASFKTANGKVTIIPAQEGVGPDIDSLALTLSTQLPDEAASRTIELRTHRTQPEITTEKARTMGVKERISTYTTTYDSGNRPRVNNIHTLGDALDGKLVPPGGTFSFNGAVGERTAEKGYKEANAIVKGKLVPQLGGGICQVGTTLFNTIFESGLPVLERQNHSFYISHYPKGRDATVSWGGPDLKFKNDTKNWILLSVAYSSSSITISFYGTDPGYEVEAKTSAWRPGAKFPSEQVKDPTLDVGTKVIEDSGLDGRSITVERIVKKDGKVIRTDTFVSNYKPKTEVVRVGTKPVPNLPSTSTPVP